MGYRRIIYILLCGVAVSLLTVACSKSNDTQGDEEPTWYEQIYFNITRSVTTEVDTDGRTYNFTLFGDTDGNTYYSGTYRLPAEGEDLSVLYPCEVDGTTGAIKDDGAFNSTYGLSAPAGNYQIVVASPAVAVSSINDHTGTTRKGFKVDRHINDNSESEVDLFIKGPRDVSVSGVEIGGEKEYTSSEYDLSRPRSKFVLYIRSDDAAKSYSVYDVYFNNILDTGYYNPTVGYYRKDDGVTDNFSPYINTALTAISTSTKMEVSSENNTTVADSIGNTIIDNAFYLIANDCSGGESTYVAVPHLVIKLNRNGENNEDEASVVTIPLEYDFQRSYYYEFTITISPVAITLSGIAVAEWEEVDGGDITVENLTSIIFEYDAVGNWEEGYGGTTTFI